MRLHLHSLELLDVADEVWRRLPDDARAALQGVRIVEDTTITTWADAGDFDIRIRPLLTTRATIAGVLAHELGHIAGSHYRRCAAGALSRDAAEQEADLYARAWGFGAELDARARWYGR